MTQQAIFHGKHRTRRFGVLQEKRIMPHTQPQQNVEFCFRIVEYHGLQNRIAHGLKTTYGDFLIVLNANFFFWDSAHLANHGLAPQGFYIFHNAAGGAHVVGYHLTAVVLAGLILAGLAEEIQAKQGDDQIGGHEAAGLIDKHDPVPVPVEADTQIRLLLQRELLHIRQIGLYQRIGWMVGEGAVQLEAVRNKLAGKLGEQGGDDQAKGTSESEAWRTLGKVSGWTIQRCTVENGGNDSAPDYGIRVQHQGQGALLTGIVIRGNSVGRINTRRNDEPGRAGIMAQGLFGAIVSDNDVSTRNTPGIRVMDTVRMMLDHNDIHACYGEHLAILNKTKLVQRDRYGSIVHYSLNRKTLEEFKRSVRKALGEEFILLE